MRTLHLAGGAPSAKGGVEGERPRIGGIAYTAGDKMKPRFGVSATLATMSAFDGSCDDVVLNAAEHGAPALARTTAGNLSLDVNAKTFDYVADVDVEDHGFSDAWRRVDRGVLDAASLGFAFSAADAEWSLDEDTGIILETIHKVARVFEITLTENPRMQQTSARTMIDTGVGELTERDMLASVPKSLLADQRRILSARSTARPDFTARNAAMAARAKTGR